MSTPIFFGLRQLLKTDALSVELRADAVDHTLIKSIECHPSFGTLCPVYSAARNREPLPSIKRYTSAIKTLGKAKAEKYSP